MTEQRKNWKESRTFLGQPIDVIYVDAGPVHESNAFTPGQTVADGIVYDRDVAVQLRDGTTIYTDVYRPEGSTGLLPAIVAWSPYGKRAGYATSWPTPGVRPDTYSPATKMEGPDPYYWCYQGYAVINPDARGAGNSEGDVLTFSSAEGRDAADLIEWVAAQEWSNGKVGMTGNSWLAVSQWFAAAEQPPHLACIAPWDGFVDAYDSLFVPGGVLETGFCGAVIAGMQGNNGVEDSVQMGRTHPVKDAYWLDKIARVEEISIPVYVSAGWTNPLHTKGSIDGFRRLNTDKKWLRAHREFEWPDYYESETMEDLKRFFDRYLKGIRNGWEMTPRVRVDVMDTAHINYESLRGEEDFPLPRTQYKKLHLDAGALSLSEQPVATESSVSYDALTGSATFDLAFEETTELTGYMSLRLWVEAEGADDMDIFLAVQKADADGEFSPVAYLGNAHPGAMGILRVSHRELDEAASEPFAPVQKHEREQLLTAGEVVPVDIAIWPSSRIWYAGERLRLVVSGHRQPRLFIPAAWETRNQGTHILHTGGTHDSHLLVPVIPKPALVAKPADTSGLFGGH
ncbi:CocE/NonD family hydrolase [Leifsonia poae]|uniref:CocE/NonD family hydrolase n=1 Tax=Leifsonia poae TaxID=110933 RepID=UPI003D66898B